MITRAVMLAAGVVTPQIGQDITLLHAADECPMYAMLLNQWDQQFAHERKVQWASRAMDGRSTQINNGGAAYDAATVTVVVDSNACFFVNAVVRGRTTGEILLCTAVNANGTGVTFVRGWGNADGAPAAHANTVADDAWLDVIGGARAEAADTPTERQNNAVLDYNYSQIFRQAIKQSGTADATDTFTKNEFADQKAARMSEMLRDIEDSLIRGRRSLTAVSSEMIGTMGGIETFIATNTDNVGGTMSRARMRTALDKAWSIGGSSVKWGFAGDTAAGAVNEIFESKLQTKSGESMPGLIVQDVPLSRGLLKLVRHRRVTTGNIIVVDPANVRLRPMQNEKSTGQPRGLPHERVKRQGPGVDGRTDELLADLNVEWGPEAFHALITGITGAA